MDDEVFGVILYVAPEVLRTKKYITASDIYSCGMIIWEIWNREYPFSSCSHDITLIYNICDKIWPAIPDGIPKYYQELMIYCWDQNPSKRPIANEIFNIIREWDYFTIQNKVKKYIENRGKKRKIHIDAIYKSRSISKIIEEA
ncbi:14492_t:CDS:1, partial [Ambispora leptoticha]